MQWLIDIVTQAVLAQLSNLVSLNAIDPAESVFAHGAGAGWQGVTGPAARDALDLGVLDDPTFRTLELNLPGTQNYLFTGRPLASLAVQSQDPLANSMLELYTKKGDGSKYAYLRIFVDGIPTDITNIEDVALQVLPNFAVELRTYGRGTGVTLPLSLYAYPHAHQLVCRPDGHLEVGVGPIDFTLDMGDSTKDPTTAPPDDWIETEIAGVTGYVPWYLQS